MAKISKALAESIVRKVVEKLEERVKDYGNEFAGKAVEYYMLRVPKEIVALMSNDSCRNYIKKTTSFYINGMGFNNQWVTIKVAIPDTSNKLSPTAAEAKVLQKLYDKLQDTEDKLDSTKIELTATLLGLGTTKRVAEQLPDLIPYLPSDSNKNMGLMAVPEKMKQTVSCLLSQDSKCLDKI